MKKHTVRSRRSLGIWRILGLSLLFMFLIGIFLLSGFLIWATTIDLPDFNLFTERKVSQSTKIFDRTGQILLYDVHKDVRRTIVPFDAISPYIKNATVAIEDDQFYEHIGIKPKAILRAILFNLQSGEYSQGGSTITQQVIKMALLTKEKKISRKLKEWVLAIRLERIMDKEQILALYLNESPYGGNIYGIEEASRTYFGKHASEVTMAEAAYLAALPQAPTLYSPYGNNIDRLEKRKNLVLERMRELRSITEDEYVEAKKERVLFVPPNERGIRAPHFVMFIKEQLVELYGEEVLHEGGLKVITTLDLRLQEKGEELVKKYAEENSKQFNASNAALVAIDPKNGEILTMVGSRDYFDTTIDGNYNIALALRQPGSSFKPFVYGAAFEKGYTPDTVVFDSPTEFSTRCNAFGQPNNGADPSVCYMPENYDHIYRGPMSLREALAQSVNVPAVKMLYLVGIDSALDFAKRVGVGNLVDKARYGLTLVLGGGEVTLLDMTSAYGVFANDGKKVSPQGILRIEDSAGTIIQEYKPKEEQVIDKEIAYTVSDVLSDNVARTPAFGAQSYLYFPERKVAVKTGTTNDYRDAWIVGYTPSLVVGAWAGNNDNSPMEKKVAGFIIAPLWNAFFKEAFLVIPDEKFPSALQTPNTIKPVLRGIWYGNTTFEIDTVSGLLATPFTPKETRATRVIPDPHEILHWVNKDDPTGPVPNDPGGDAQYWLWEIPAQLWITANGLPSNAISSIPSGYDNIHTESTLPKLSFIGIDASSTYQLGAKFVAGVLPTALYPIRNVELFINDTFVGSVTEKPYLFSFVPSEVGVVNGKNTLRAIGYDVMQGKSEISTTIDFRP